MMVKRILTYIFIISFSAIIAYFIWFFFSHMIVPVKGSPREIQVIEWPHDGYYKYRPGIHFNKWYNVHFRINSDGYHGEDFTEKRGTRVVVIGESSVMGVNYTHTKTWPARLEYYLGVEVLNCGIAGSLSANHVNMVDEILALKPDLIIYYAGINDHQTKAEGRYPGRKIANCGRLRYFKGWLVFKKIQVRFLLLKLLGYDINNILPFKEWRSKYRSNLERLIEKVDVPFVIVTQVLDYPEEVFKALANGEKVIEKISMNQRRWQVFFRHQDLLAIQKKVAKKYNIPLIDIHRDFYISKLQDKHLFDDYVHLTPQGNDALAKIIARKLKSNSILSNCLQNL